MENFQPDSTVTRDLLEQSLGGDARARDVLFARHRAFLRQFAMLRMDPKLRARVDPSDVVQETQMEAARRFDQYLKQPAMPFRLWLRQIAYDRLLKLRRHHIQTARRAIGNELPLPERSSLAFAQQLLARSASPSERVGRRELVQRLRQAMAKLSDSDREVLLMRHFEGLSNQEVGLILDIDPVAVSKRLGRAVLRLHRILLEGGMRESEL